MEPGITITRTFTAPPTAVFAAWTDATQLVRWLAQPGFTGTATIDPTVGGIWTSETSNPDVPHLHIHFHGVYQEVIEPTRLVLTLRTADEPGEEVVTVDLVPTEEGTMMTFSQGGDNLARDEYVRAASGWEIFFGRLEKLLTTSAN